MGIKTLSIFWPSQQQYFNVRIISNGDGQIIEDSAKTIRANFDDKIRILFEFIKDPAHQGIRYRQFLKMLYHYSKEELKQIMVNDGVFVHDWIIPPKENIKQNQGSIIHMKHHRISKPALQKKTSFEMAYQDIIDQYEDPGTSMHFKTENMTYKIDYINMISLTKQFASHIFHKYGIKQDNGSMNQSQFKQWVKGNNKLFETYFSAFRENLWGFTNKSPNFIAHIQKQCAIQMIQSGVRQKLYMMLVENTLFLSVGINNKSQVFRIICLDGLAVNMISKIKMEIKDTPNGLSKFQLVFENQNLAMQWLNALSNFQKNYVQTKYNILQPIGTGKFSVVYKALDQKTRKPYALKVIDLDKLNPRGKQSIQNQTKIMKILKSPSIIKHYQTIYSKHNIYITTEYVFGQDLFQYVKRNRRLDEFQAAFILGKIIQAVIHLHSLDIIHRDLKPENIMIQFQRQAQSEMEEVLSPCRLMKPQAETVKIIDLGFSNYYTAFQSDQQSPIEGTPNYIAPEVFLGQKPSFQNDIFAIGSILYFMLRGKFPFTAGQMQGVAVRTVRGDYSLQDAVWDKISEQAKDLVEMMLQVDPRQRITLKSALNHPWFLYINPYEKSRRDSTDHQ